MSNKNANIFTTPSSSPAGSPMVTPRTHWSNEPSQEINAQMAALPNEIRAANGANRSVEQALQAPIAENGASNQRAAIAANAAMQPAAANARLHVLANEVIAANVVQHVVPNVAANVAPVEPDHPSVRLIDSPIFIARMFQTIAICASGASSVDRTGSFNATHLSLIGGSVLTIYDYILREYRARKVGRLRRLREYIQDATRDMDIVWYMTNKPNQAQVKPDLTRSVGRALAEYLQDDSIKIEMESFIQEIIELPVVIQIRTIDKVDRFGTFTIHIEVAIDGYDPFNICDCAVHDGYSSQQYDDNHVEFQRTNARGNIIHRAVATDPTYCDLYNTFLIQVNGSYIRIPQIGRFVDQQIFAFGNLALHYDVARQINSMKNLKRGLYLLRLMSLIDTSNAQNTRDIGQLILSNDLSIQLFVNYLFLKLNKKINMILNTNISLRPLIITVLGDFNYNNAPMEVLGGNSRSVHRMLERLLHIQQAQLYGSMQLSTDASAAYRMIPSAPVFHPMQQAASIHPAAASAASAAASYPIHPAAASAAASYPMHLPHQMQHLMPPRPPRPQNKGKPRNNGSKRKGGNNKRKTRKHI